VTTRVEIILQGSDQLSGPVRAAKTELGGLSGAAQNAGGAMGFLQNALSFATGGAILQGINSIAGSIGGVASAMIGGNAQFETYQTQFGVLLGSAQAAKDRLAELAQFGASTPFELPQVVEADKILQSFGLHAADTAAKFGMSGAEIRTIAGDVASGTGASFTEIANYLGKFSSGATGEALARFQELGIVTKAELAGMGVAFDKAGSMTTPVNDAMDILLVAMKDKFGGMMAAQSSTFAGMVSNLMDWKSQALRIAGEPIFNALKDQLAGLLQILNSDQAQAAVLAMGQGIASGINVALGALQSLAPVAQAAMGTLQTMGTVWGGLSSGALAFSEALQMLNVPEGLVDPLMALEGSISTVVATAQILGPALAEVFQGGEQADALAAAVDALSGGMSVFAPAAQVAGAAASSLGQALLAAANIAGIVAGTAQTLADIAGGVLVSAMQTAGQVAGVVWGGLPGLLLAAADPLQTIAAVTSSVLVAAFANLGTAIETGLSLLPGLAATGMATLTALAGIVGGTLAGAFQALQGPAITVTQVVGSVLAGAFQTLAGVATAVLNALPGLFMAVAGPVQTIAGLAGGLLAGAFQAFGQIAQSVFSILPGLAQTLMGVLTTAAGVVTSVLAGAFQILQPIAVSVFQAIATVVQYALPHFQTLANSVGSLVVTAFQSLQQVALAVFAAIQPYVPALQNAIGVLAGAVGNLLGGTFSALAGIIDSIVIPAVQTLGNWMSQFLPGAIGVAMGFITGTVLPIFTTLVNWLAEVIPGALGSLAGFWQAHGDQIVGAAQAAWGLIQGAVETVLATVGQLWSAWNSAREGDWRGFGEKLREIWDGAWNTIVNVVSTVGPRVLEAINTLLGQARDAFTGIDWGKLGGDIVRGIADGVRNAGGSIINAMSGAAQAALNAGKGALGIQSPSAVMRDEVGRPITEGLAAGILAGSPDAVNAMLFVAGNISSAARQLVNTVQAYGRGLGSELEALQDLASSMGGVVSIINAVGDALTRLTEIGANLGDTDAATGLAYTLSHTALGLVQAMQGQGRGLGSEVERLQDLADAIKSVALIMGAIQEALTSLAGLGAVDLSGLDQMRDVFARLATWAAEASLAAGAAAGGVSAGLAPALTALGEATGAAAGVAKSALDLANALVAALAFDWAAVNWGAARDMLVGLVTLAGFLVGYADRAATGFEAVGAGLANLQAALGPTSGIAKGTLELARALVDALAFDWNATNWGVARDMLVGLVTLAGFLVGYASRAAVAFAELNTAGLTPLRDALGPVVSIARDALALVALLADNITVNLDPARLTTMNRLLYDLAIWARNFATAAALASAAFASVNATGVAPLRAALEPVVSIVENTLASIAALQTASATGLPDVSQESALDRLLYQIAVWGRNLVTAAGLATATLSTVNLSGLRPLVDALKTIQPIVEGTLAALAAVVGVDTAALPDLSQETAIDRALRDLVIWGRNLVLAASLGAAGLTEANTAGLQPLARALETIKPIIEGALQATAAVLALNATSLPDISQESGIDRALYDLAIWARNLASAAALGAAAFGSVNTSGLRPLRDALGVLDNLISQTMTVLAAVSRLEGVDLPDLGDGTALQAALDQALQFARGVADAAVRAGAGFVLAETVGLRPMADAIRSSESVFNAVTGLLEVFANPPGVPDIGDGSAVGEFLDRALGLARAVADAAVAAATGFTLAENVGLRPLADAVRGAFGVLDSITRIPDLVQDLDQVAAVNLDQLKTRVATIMPVLGELARSFADEAQQAGISEAWAEAGQRVAAVIGDAVGALGDTIEVALKLVDPELMLPSVAQLAPKLSAVLRLLNATVTAFANEADSIQIDQDAATRLANTVKPITDALGGLIDLVQSFTGLNLGMSGYANLRSFLTMIFDVFEDFSPDASKVNAVAAALSTMLGGLQNVANVQGIAIGGSLVDGIVTGIQQGSGKLAGALQGALGGAQLTGTANAAGKVQAGQIGALNGGSGGQTTINNYYTTNNIVNLSQVVPSSVAAQTATSAVAGALFKGNPV